MVSASEPKAHSKFSASGSDRWLNCPGSIALAAKAPTPPESVYAKEGTDAHLCLETILKNHTKRPYTAAKMLEQTYPSQMVTHALRAYEYIIAHHGEGKELLCETKVDLTFIAEGMFGTVDAAVVDLFGTLWVYDYKYGAGRLVTPENNSQMMYYALGLAHKYNYNFLDVEIVIGQPRIVHKDGFNRTWKTDIATLKSFGEVLKKGVEECKDPFAVIKSGRWCYFCPAQSICPAIENEAFENAQADFK